MSSHPLRTAPLFIAAPVQRFTSPRGVVAYASDPATKHRLQLIKYSYMRLVIGSLGQQLAGQATDWSETRDAALAVPLREPAAARLAHFSKSSHTTGFGTGLRRHSTNSPGTLALLHILKPTHVLHRCSSLISRLPAITDTAADTAGCWLSEHGLR
jgi:hypothetical protein